MLSIRASLRALLLYNSIHHLAVPLIVSALTYFSFPLVIKDQGNNYVVVMVDMFSRYVILAPIKEKTPRAVAHAVVSRPICEHTAPRVLLSDNGAEFRNKVLAEICTQFGITQTFPVVYHPASNGLVERTNRKILEILLPKVGSFIGYHKLQLP